MQPYIPHPPVGADDPAYVRAARNEAAFWSNPAMISIADAMALAPLNVFTRYLNQRLTGNPEVRWYESLARHGPFERGLILGCGGMVQEERLLATNPQLHATIVDIDEASLQRRLAVFGQRYPGRVTTRCADLNFATLDPESYDLVVSADTLHHVVNLEHVAGQINRALTPDGQFFLYDYTGPSGFRFPAGQRRMFELLYERERRHSKLVLPDIAWTDVDAGNHSPFEAVRSAETLGIVSSQLMESERRGGGAAWLFLFAGIADRFDRRQLKSPGTFERLNQQVRGAESRVIKRRQTRRRAGPRLVFDEMLSETCLREIALVDRVLSDAFAFPANNTFARYRKR